VGWDNVKLVVTRGRFSPSKSTHSNDLKTIDKYLEVPNRNIISTNIEETLKAISDKSFETPNIRGGSLGFGAIPLFNYNLSYYLLRGMANSEIDEKTFAPPVKKPITSREQFIQRSIAYYKSKIRLNMLLAFLVAESENCSFIGSVNKTEWLLGLFTKFGSYHAADFLPLADLYRSQTIELGKHLNLNHFLETRDLNSPTSYLFFFDVSYNTVDRILVRLENKMTVEQIREETNYSPEVIKKIEYHFLSSQYARSVPFIPSLQ
jgi:NH3-dependent NAD+ synthetase